MSHAQQVFDKVVTHLLTQNEKAQVGKNCMYYAGTYSKPLKCAVGCLISEEHYTVKLEGLGVKHFDLEQALQLSGIEVTQTVAVGLPLLDLLADLQQIHDVYLVDKWFDSLKGIAQEYSLAFSPPVATETQNA